MEEEKNSDIVYPLKEYEYVYGINRLCGLLIPSKEMTGFVLRLLKNLTPKIVKESINHGFGGGFTKTYHDNYIINAILEHVMKLGNYKSRDDFIKSLKTW